MLASLSFGLVAFGALLRAADVTGTWNLHWKTPDGYQHDSQLTLTETSGKLSGQDLQPSRAP